METVFSKKFASALGGLGVRESAKEGIEGKTKVIDILKNPVEFITLIKRLGIAPSNFIPYKVSLSKSKHFMLEKLTQEGYERVLAIGGYSNGLKRAQMLAELGFKNGMAALYPELNVSDLEATHNYEMSGALV